MIRLGIDTGGTYTDAVIVDTERVRVLAQAKALTTKGDLVQGICNAIDALPRELLGQARQAALSTTLATNACVEGKGGRARLIIVGSSDSVLRRVDAQGKFGIPYSDVLTLPFEGSYDGNDVVIPDWEEVYRQNHAFFDEAESFGIASIYALNNGAAVEKSGAAFLRERFGKFVVQATEVAADPNVIERGATALLNARLVPVIGEFLNAVDDALALRGLSLPISVVRSDGTLMSEELARSRPVETILSGPAASAIGALALADRQDGLVVDIGGTTSDMCIVHGSRASRTDGIVIGGWKTQVAGVKIDTIALGGDTEVRFAKDSKLRLGTRRVMPLCIAAQRWPQILELLQRYLALPGIDFHARYELLYLLREPADLAWLKPAERQLVEVLREGPAALFEERMQILGLKPERLEDEGIVMRCGMTPADAMHLKGDFDQFDERASRLGAQCVLMSYRGRRAVEDAGEIARLADEIYDLARYRLYQQAIGALAQDRYWPDEPASLDGQLSAIARRTWEGRREGSRHLFDIGFASAGALVGVGAPTHVFLPEVADALNAPCCIPEHANVANAVGAAVSRIFVEQQVRVVALRGPDGVVQGYRVLGADEAATYGELEDALEAARAQASELARAEALRRGATGDLHCTTSEDRRVYRSTAVLEIVREWTVSARLGDEG